MRKWKIISRNLSTANIQDKMRNSKTSLFRSLSGMSIQIQLLSSADIGHKSDLILFALTKKRNLFSQEFGRTGIFPILHFFTSADLQTTQYNIGQSHKFRMRAVTNYEIKCDTYY